AVAAANITATNATLEAYVNPNGSPATAWFSYGTSQVYSATNVVPNVGNGVSPVLVTANISGLTAGTVYHFQVSTTNSFGFATSSDQAFEALNPPFTETTISVPGGAPNASGDFDDDGQLDILFQNGFADTEVWRNTGDGFSDLAGGLPVIRGGSVALGDFDNDGRLDIVLTTHTNNNDGFSETYLTQIWRNTGNGFSNINSALPAVYDSSIAVGDFDNDGRQDILIAGYDEFGNPLTQLWRNTGNGFTNINAGLPGVGACSVAWGDFDNDGRPDILLSGYTGNQGGINFALFITQVWRNTGNGFTNINAGLPGVYFGTAEWGDFDNDGRLDILISGTEQDGTPITQLWRNTGNGFVKAMDVAAFGTASVPLGDYNQDGRLDLFLGSQLWVNQALFTNTPPSAPTGLSAAISGSQLTLSWNASSDLQTPAAGLSYNVRVGTTPGGSDIVNPMALTNGTRLIASRGSIQTTNFTVQLPFTPVPGTLLFWSVQSIDTGFEGSPFAPEATFQVRPAFTGWGRLSDGAFEGQFYALAGTNYFIQASTDLVHWQDLLDFNFDNGGPIMFTDPNATNYPRRFYRFGQH
ncbi:MAG TPA: VCBS repeat-containing protein, partial [Verrucomicrobiae bacterium]|nr:VCBS repeat-containing protein [Verrucomicrobiae bacterium]